jgi:hypothetical protein
MEIKKKGDNTFNVYAVSLSWGQLIALHQILSKDHSSPVLDEMFAELDWYLNELPKPGESKEKEKGEGEEGAAEGGAPEGPGEEGPGAEGELPADFLDKELPPPGSAEEGPGPEAPPEEEPEAGE